MKQFRYNRGISLISLLVATAIGIFIVGAAGKTYVDSKMAFQARSAVSAVTENGRFALDDMRRTVVMAGRAVKAGDDSPQSYNTSDNGKRTFPAIGTSGIRDKDANDNSVIAIRYGLGPSCGGYIGTPSNPPGVLEPTPQEPPATVRFLVNDEKELLCEADTNGDGSFDVNEPLVSGIEKMRALYGVDDDADGYANRYLTATEVQNENVWVNVVSIRVGLVASSGSAYELPDTMQPQSAQTLSLLGLDYTAPDTKEIYRAVSATISLRNLNTVVQRQ